MDRTWTLGRVMRRMAVIALAIGATRGWSSIAARELGASWQDQILAACGPAAALLLAALDPPARPAGGSFRNPPDMREEAL